MKLTLLALGLILPFVSGCAAPGSPRVTVKRISPSAIRVKVVERTKDPFRHLPAVCIYRFTVPASPIVRADAIREYVEKYRGSDGTADIYKAPTGGFIKFPDLATLQQVEIRLIGGHQCACHVGFPLSINGTHRIAFHN
jgi:hypothetical protein